MLIPSLRFTLELEVPLSYYRLLSKPIGSLLPPCQVSKLVDFRKGLIPQAQGKDHTT